MRVSGMNIPQHMVQSALQQFQDWVSEHLPEAAGRSRRDWTGRRLHRRLPRCLGSFPPPCLLAHIRFAPSGPAPLSIQNVFVVENSEAGPLR
jgi:hypothetical protein